MLGVGLQIPVGFQQAEDGVGQRRGSAHILGQTAHIKGPGPGLQTGEQIDKAGSDGGAAKCQGRANADGAAGRLAESAIVGEGLVVFQQAGKNGLLVIDAGVQPGVLSVGEGEDIGGNPVPEGGIPGKRIVDLRNFSVERPGPEVNADKNGGKHQKKYGTVKNCQRTGRLGDLGEKQTYGQADASKHTQQAIEKVFIDIGCVHQPKAEPVFILGNLCPQVLGLLLVRIGVVHGNGLFAEENFLTAPDIIQQRFLPLLEKAPQERHQAGDDYRHNDPFPEDLRPALPGQFRKNPGGEIHRHIGQPGGQKGFDGDHGEKFRIYRVQRSDGPKLHGKMNF